MSDELPTPEPPITPETEQFWDATCEDVLLLTLCSDCGDTFHYPRARCPHCASSDTEWINASGRGTIYSYTVTRKTGGEYANATPFVLAYVELDEGPRIMTNIVDHDLNDIEVGQRVKVRFHEIDEDHRLPRFTPV